MKLFGPFPVRPLLEMLIAWGFPISVYIFYDLIELYRMISWPDVIIIQDICTIVEAIELKQAYNGVLQSPGYPGHYSNNLVKRWRIIVPSGTVSLSLLYT